MKKHVFISNSFIWLFENKSPCTINNIWNVIFLGLFRDVTLEDEMERFICNHVLSNCYFGSLITCDSILRHYSLDLVVKTVCFDLETGTFHVEYNFRDIEIPICRIPLMQTSWIMVNKVFNQCSHQWSIIVFWCTQ